MSIRAQSRRFVPLTVAATMGVGAAAQADIVIPLTDFHNHVATSTAGPYSDGPVTGTITTRLIHQPDRRARRLPRLRRRRQGHQ